MLEGINVLNTIVCNNSIGWGGSIFLALSITMIIIACVLLIQSIFDSFFDTSREGIKIRNIIEGTLTFVVFILLIFGVHSYMSYEDYNQYQVTMNEEVSVNEFEKNYEMISHEGDIYTIIEKDSAFVEN